MEINLSDHPPITFTLLLFASLRDVLGGEQISVVISEIPLHEEKSKCDTISAKQLLLEAAQQYPALVPWMGHVKIAVNCEYVSPDHPVRPTDEIALLPPVSGGSISTDQIDAVPFHLRISGGIPSL
jgi:molybdopterin converting factor small subunit